MTPDRHAGRSVLVTGSASGIGLGIVERFLSEGARVAGFDLRPTDVTHERFLRLTGDATSEADVERAVAEVVARQGGLDVMVCNAGVIAVGPVAGAVAMARLDVLLRRPGGIAASSASAG